MHDVVDNLPPGVTMSDHFKDKVRRRVEGKRKHKYIRVLHFGRSYYIPITSSIWKAFALKGKISDEADPEDGTYELKDWEVGQAVADIVGAIQLQVRCDVLNGIEQSVTQTVQDKLAAMMHAPLRKELERMADEKDPKLLEEPKDGKTTKP